MYSKSVNIDVLLKGHAGDTIRVDRIGRNSESIEKPALTMLLSVQPNILAGMMQNSIFRGRGLTARFLYCFPVSHVGDRKYRSQPIPDDVTRGYDSLIHNLLDEDCNPSLEAPEIITLSQDADMLLEEFANEIEPKLKGEYADIADWAGKLVGAVLRISAILWRASNLRCEDFLQEDVPDAEVDTDTMYNAITLGRYYIEHARAAYSLMGADPVKYALSSICYCPRCGDIYLRIKNNQSASWKCATRVENGPTACDAPLVPERELHNAVLRGINMVLSGRDNMMTKLKENIERVLLEEGSTTIDEIDAKLETLQQELIKRAGAKQDYEDLADEIDALRTKRLEAMTEKAEREGLKMRIKEMQDFLESQTDRIGEYDEQLVRKMIEKITIYDDKFLIEFKSGTSLDVRR